MKRRIFQEYWKYYIHLEQLLINTLDFVALNKNNFRTYSNQYASILQLTGAELDAFFKSFFEIKRSNDFNIKIYIKQLIDKQPELIQQRVRILDTDIILIPFEKCKGVLKNRPMTWWKAFTGIKHNRIEYFSKATLENCLLILSALYMLECQCILEIGKKDKSADSPNPESKLFVLEDWKAKWVDPSNSLMFEIKK